MRSSQSTNTGGKPCIIHYTETKKKIKVQQTWVSRVFKKIQDVAKLKLAESDPACRLETISRNVPDVFDESVRGIRRQCYQKCANTYFVYRKRSLKSTPESTDSDTQPRLAKTRRSVGSAPFSSPLYPKGKSLICDNKKDLRKKCASLFSQMHNTACCRFNKRRCREIKR